MSKSSLGKPFRVVRKIDLKMMYAIIEMCAGLGTLVVNFNYELGHYKPLSLFIFE